MRPIDTHELRTVNITDNTEARNLLYQVVGSMCSYCEMRIDNMGEREHVESTSKGGDLASMKNTLLACKYCNTRKSDLIVSRDECIWPDEDNTFLAYEYLDDGSVLVALDPRHPAYAQAERLWSVCGLNSIPDAKHSDQRRRSRIEAWAKAMDARLDWETLVQCDPQTSHPHLQSTCKMTAQAASTGGFFSVWMCVFSDVDDMKNALINAFKGTAKDCFDAKGNPVSRKNGKL